jgi:hypothetical protein
MSRLTRYVKNFGGPFQGEENFQPCYLIADVEEVVKDARVLAEWFADISKRGNPMPVKEATRLLARLEGE